LSGLTPRKTLSSERNPDCCKTTERPHSRPNNNIMWRLQCQAEVRDIVTVNRTVLNTSFLLRYVEPISGQREILMNWAYFIWRKM